MSHELIMLRYAKRMRKLSQVLTKEARIKAIKSHASVNVKGGTMGQIEEICQILKLRDDCLCFCSALLDGLSVLDCDARDLLIKYYIKRVGMDALVKQLNVTVSAVYRRLAAARARFSAQLSSLGYDRQWFNKHFERFRFNDGKIAKA